MGVLLIGAIGCDSGVDKSVGEPVVLPTKASQASFIPASVPTVYLQAPPPPQQPEQRISGQDAGYAESELPILLGYLWYPDARLSLCSHSQRRNGLWPSVTLVMPANEKPRDIINYYETRYPGGERKGNEEYFFQTRRPGDDRLVTVRLLRATSGSEATRFVAQIHS